MPNFFCYDGFLSIIQMCCFVCCMTTISLQFGYKDSANRRQCKIKVPKLLFLLNFRRKGKLKKLKKLRKLKTYVKAQKTPERKRKDYCL